MALQQTFNFYDTYAISGSIRDRLYGYEYYYPLDRILPRPLRFYLCLFGALRVANDVW